MLVKNHGGFEGFLIKSWNLHPNHGQRTNHLNHRGVRDFHGWLATLDALLTVIYHLRNIYNFKFNRNTTVFNIGLAPLGARF